MKQIKLILMLVALLCCTSSVFAQANFSTSLHNTRNGKATWYSQANGGLESLINIPIDTLGCQQCHGPTNADGVSNGDDYQPGCTDCHPSNSNFNPDSLKVTQCYSCHGRQQTVAMKLQLPDVHRDAGMVCWDCHKSEEIHGDGTEYISLFDDGAVKAQCTDCHIDENSTPPMPDHSQYDPHNGKLDCTACHVTSVAACYNCHFESQTESHLKRAYKVLSDFVMLVNRNGKVHSATFQSVEYKDTTFNAIGPGSSHTIGAGRDCEDCHGNANVQEYFNTGQIQFSTWNDADSTLSWKHGIVPIPPDYETTLKMDFITYNGNTDDPLVPSKNWSKVNKDLPDKSQMMFATPLTSTQMMALKINVGTIADNFALSQHGTRSGKEYWYGKANGGFENFTNVPIENLGCRECHGATDADGNPNDAATYSPTCSDCHPSNSAFNTDSLQVSQCYSCHSRQATEANKLHISDVHRDAGMKCWDCHKDVDMHGDGTESNSMLDPQVITADCANDGCHPAGSLPADHANNDPHNGKLHCTACHAQTVLSCYNCHFESVNEAHIKRAYKPLTGFVILANREKDGKVYPMSFQSLSNNGDAFVAFGPFTSHSITKDGARTCTDCHENFGGQNEAIEDYNADGILQFATWNETDSTLTWEKGVIPMPADYKTSWKMDFITYNGNTSDPAGPSKNWSKIGKDTWDGHQMFFATPLTKAQMGAIGFDTTLTDVKKDPNLIPTSFALMQNYPNPFNPSTIIQYSIPKTSEVELNIYDLLGNKVETLVNKEQTAGVYNYEFNANKLASGVYFYRIKAGNFVQTKKFVLMK